MSANIGYERIDIEPALRGAAMNGIGNLEDLATFLPIEGDT